MTRIAILDYGMGNLRSVEKAVEHVGADPVRTSDLKVAGEADGLILPGVGAFPEAMARLQSLEMDAFVQDWVAKRQPLLGICLGMQLLFEDSTELGGSTGLGVVPGHVTSLESNGFKLPHIGWEPLQSERSSRFLDGLPDSPSFYFVHTFVARPAEPHDVIGTAGHGEQFAAIVERDRVWGVQFHPEKSSTSGLRLLATFVDICA